MKIIVAIAEEHAREGLGTVFYHGDSEITPARIENFKRRKTTKESDAASPSDGERMLFILKLILMTYAELPGAVTYQIPPADKVDSVHLYDLEQSSEQSHDHGSYQPIVTSQKRKFIINSDQTPIFAMARMVNSSSSMSLSNSTLDSEGLPYVASFEQNRSVLNTGPVPGSISTLQPETILATSPTNPDFFSELCCSW